MRLRHVLVLTALAALPAGQVLAAGPICSPTLRAGRVVGAGSADCSYNYKIDGANCSAKGKCPEQNGQRMHCIVTGTLTYSWTVTKTGGTGSVSPATFTGPLLTVTVVPPVDYTVESMVDGCKACCSLNPPTCDSPAATTPAKAAALEKESKGECGGR